ncbi:MAG: hypothetical protein RBR98_00940 [Candidatus Moranbacteria bacterium]|jgi:energy-converting hydrogenase Eha subunit F|nr:hypothetical protein [Candidatus Moranbacteria bacterium]
MEEKEKNEIRDAEIDEIESDSENNDNTQKNYRTEVILILIIGLLLGIMLKAEALKNISIGFSDYKVKGGLQAYDVEQIEKEIKEKQEAQKAEAEANAKKAQEATNGEQAMPAEENNNQPN